MPTSTSGSVQLPALQVTGILLESTSPVNASGTAALTLPLFALASRGRTDSGNAGAVTLPLIEVAGRGLTALAGNGAVTLPAITGEGRGRTAELGYGAVTLPAIVVKGLGGSAGGVTLPAPQISGRGITGVVATGHVRLPAIKASGVGRTQNTATAQIVLSPLRVGGQGVTGVTGRAAITLPPLHVAGKGFTGTTGRGAVVLPAIIVAGAGYMPAIGAGAITLPAWQIAGIGVATDIVPALPDGVVYPALVMHTETGALTQYANFPFNSFATFNGVYLAASAEGIFTLDGDTDDGTKIPALARVGITDFGTSYLKRVDRCYVGYRTDGNLVLRVYTDEVTQRDYLLRATGKEGLHGNHTRIGRGLRARYWQFEVQNQNGANFELNAIELKPTHLRRRVGGGDA